MRFAIGALLLVSVLALTSAHPTGVGGRAAAVVGDIASRAVAYARGLAPGTGTIEGLDPKVVRPTAVYTAYPQGPLGPGEIHAVPVTIRNQGDDTWERTGPHAVTLAYHVYDASGALLTWDGPRSALPSDVPPGSEATVAMVLTAPPVTGAYMIRPDLVRDGEGWFSAEDAAPGMFSLRVTTDMDAGYGPTTAPATIVPGGEVPIEVQVHNTGLQAWPAGGATAVRLGYHWLDGTSVAVMWDGARAGLPHDVQPGEAFTFTVTVRAPRAEGTFILAWDMVQEGAGWFSGHAVAAKHELVRVQDGVTLYGKGWGHGIGLSQWGAQGWAEGAAGPKLTGEQIVARYFAGAQLGSQPITSPFRVLLSAPSTGCVGRTIGDVARMYSAGGMRLVNNLDPSVVYFDLGPDQAVRVWTDGDGLFARDERTGRAVRLNGDESFALTPKQFWDPIAIDQKGLAYRGNLMFGVRDGQALRVVNYVSSDDYMQGALPGEMPSQWEMEALRAQAITARTYAAWRQSTAGDRTWDVRDDTADQCYGGRPVRERAPPPAGGAPGGAARPPPARAPPRRRLPRGDGGPPRTA